MLLIFVFRSSIGNSYENRVMMDGGVSMVDSLGLGRCGEKWHVHVLMEEIRCSGSAQGRLEARLHARLTSLNFSTPPPPLLITPQLRFLDY